LQMANNQYPSMPDLSVLIPAGKLTAFSFIIQQLIQALRCLSLTCMKISILLPICTVLSVFPTGDSVSGHDADSTNSCHSGVDPFKSPASMRSSVGRSRGPRPARNSSDGSGAGASRVPKAPGETTHSGGRSIIRCPICGKLFNNSSALAKHKLTHSDERKYTCPKCSKAFKRQDHL